MKEKTEAQKKFLENNIANIIAKKAKCTEKMKEYGESVNKRKTKN